MSDTPQALATPTLTEGFALFDTALGTCGIAWKLNALTGVQLPEGDAAATRLRMRRRFCGDG